MAAITYGDYFTFTPYTLADLRSEVRSDLNWDEEDDTVLTNAFLLRQANRAVRELAEISEAFHLTTVVGVTSGTAEIPIPSDTAGRVLSVEAVVLNYNGSNRQLPLVTPRQLDVYYYNWQANPAVGTPYCYYQRDFSSIGLYPVPSITQGDALSVTYTAIPPDVTEDEEQFRVPVGCENAVMSYVKLHSSVKDAFGEGAARIPFYTQEWEKYKKEARRIAGAANARKKIRVGGQALLWARLPFAGDSITWPARSISG